MQITATDNELADHQSMTNESTVIELTVSEKRLLIMNCHSSYCSIEFFRFTRNHNVGLVCLPLHSTHFLQPLNVRIFKPLADAYCLKLQK